MSSPLVNAFIALGRGRHGKVDTPGWAKIAAKAFGQQRAFIDEPATGAVGKAGRGAGKSTGMAMWYHRPSAAHPGLSSVFVTISSERSRDIMMPALEQLSREFTLGLVERRKDNAMVWPNGYRVLFRGCKDRVEANKRRGTPWIRAGWDECDAISPELLEYDIHECVEPRLMDYNGEWRATGTPGPVHHGYWHELMTGAAGYPVYSWDARDNPHMRALPFFIAVLARRGFTHHTIRDRFRQQGKDWPAAATSIEAILADPELHALLPGWFRREYLGQVVQDASSLIYRLTAANHYTGDLPPNPDRVTIGLDLGGANEEQPDLDRCAWSVAASWRHLPHIHIPECWAESNVTIDTMAARTCGLLERYPTAVVQIDSAGAGKIIERTLRRMGIPIRPQVKGPKLRRIQLLQSKVRNGDLLVHLPVLLYPPELDRTRDLRQEASVLVWDETRTLHSEKCADDCWDATLGAVMPHLGDYDPQTNAIRPGTPEWEREQERLEFEAAFSETQ